MKRIALMLMAVLSIVVPSISWADTQFKLLVLAMPSKYHYEYSLWRATA